MSWKHMIGRPSSMKGKHHSEETKEKLRLANLGKKRSAESRLKQSKAQIGRKYPPSFGEKVRLSKIGKKRKTFSQEWLDNLSKARKGKKFSTSHRINLSKSLKINHGGEKNNMWKGGITKENEKVRHSIEYRLWREAVFARDNWACVWCGKRSGKGVGPVRLEADHIKPFAHYPELRFAIDNGRTLCKPCHMTTETMGRRYKEPQQLEQPHD